MTLKQYDELLQRLQNPVATKVHLNEPANPWGDFSDEELAEAALVVKDMIPVPQPYPQRYLNQSWSLSWIGGSGQFVNSFQTWLGRNFDLAQMVVGVDVLLELAIRLSERHPELKAALASSDSWDSVAPTAIGVRNQLRTRSVTGALQIFTSGVERLWRIAWESFQMHPDKVLTYWFAAFMRRMPVRNACKSIMAWPEPLQVWLVFLQERAEWLGTLSDRPLWRDLHESLWDAPGGENETCEGWPEEWWAHYIEAAWQWGSDIRLASR